MLVDWYSDAIPRVTHQSKSPGSVKIAVINDKIGEKIYVLPEAVVDQNLDSLLDVGHLVFELSFDRLFVGSEIDLVFLFLHFKSDLVGYFAQFFVQGQSSYFGKFRDEVKGFFDGFISLNSFKENVTKFVVRVTVDLPIFILFFDHSGETVFKQVLDGLWVFAQLVDFLQIKFYQVGGLHHFTFYNNYKDSDKNSEKVSIVRLLLFNL